MSNISSDHKRFIDIVKGRIRKSLGRFISHPEIIGRHGKDIVTIPVPVIDLPRICHGGKKSESGVGDGDGEIGEPLDGYPDEGDAAGDKPSDHAKELEVELTVEDLAQILGEKLQLPNLLPKGKKSISVEKLKYNTIRKVGPRSLIDLNRTFDEAIKRLIAEGKINENFTEEDLKKIFPLPEDMRFRSYNTVPAPENAAVIFFMMDVSGSMRDEQKQLVRAMSFWIDIWVSRHYPKIEKRYIIHDAEAKLVDSETFYTTHESGGTMISSAYSLWQKTIKEQFNPSEWNIYGFHFSDGDNWNDEDNRRCTEILSGIIPDINLFGYCQVASRGYFGKYLRVSSLAKKENIVIAREVTSPEKIEGALIDLFGKK